MIFFNIVKCSILGLFIKYNIYNEKILNIFLKTINKCGSIPIKMVQWIIPYMQLINVDKEILDILKNTYENCDIHSLEYTKELYKKDFYEDFDDNYEIIEIIGSGSIAQVYKIKDKNNNLYALKVKHPNSERNFRSIKLYLHIIFKLISFQNIIPLRLEDFLNQFEEQLNFVNETNNLIRFYNLYEDNNLFKIPKLYKFSENIIMMECLQGKSLNEYENNNVQHYKYHLMIFTFMNNNFFVNNFNHSDLHNYNWKISEDDKILIYDFGLCWELTNNKIIDGVDYLNQGFYHKDMGLICKAFMNFVKYSIDIDEEIIKTYFYNNNNNPFILGFKEFTYHIVQFFLKNNHLINIKVLYKIISYQNIMLTFDKNAGWDDFDHNGVNKEELNICDYYNILPKYQLYLKNEIKKFSNKNETKYKSLSKFIK